MFAHDDELIRSVVKEKLNEIITSVCMSRDFTVFLYKQGKNWDDKIYVCIWPFLYDFSFTYVFYGNGLPNNRSTVYI